MFVRRWIGAVANVKGHKLGAVSPRAATKFIGDPDMARPAAERMDLDVGGQVVAAQRKLLLDEQQPGHVSVAPFAVPAVMPSRHPAVGLLDNSDVFRLSAGHENVGAGGMIGLHSHVLPQQGNGQ